MGPSRRAVAAASRLHTVTMTTTPGRHSPEVHWDSTGIPLAPQHKAGLMNGSDLIVLAPWIIFAICLVVLCARLLRARRSAPRPPSGRRRHDR
jgi:hypothetical protein